MLNKHKDPRLLSIIFQADAQKLFWTNENLSYDWPLGKRDFIALCDQFQDTAAFDLYKNCFWIMFENWITPVIQNYCRSSDFHSGTDFSHFKIVALNNCILKSAEVGIALTQDYSNGAVPTQYHEVGSI